MKYTDPTGMSVEGGDGGEKLDNDYFDSKGNHIYSDNKGDKIIVVGDDVINKGASLSDDDKSDLYIKEGQLLGDVDFTGNGNALGKIGQFYYNCFVGGSATVTGGNLGADPMSVMLNEDFERFIEIWFSSFSGKIGNRKFTGEMMSNIYNLSSMLAHENEHYLNDYNKTRFGYGQKLYENYDEQHNIIFRNGMSYPVYQNATKEFKKRTENEIK